VPLPLSVHPPGTVSGESVQSSGPTATPVDTYSDGVVMVLPVISSNCHSVISRTPASSQRTKTDSTVPAASVEADKVNLRVSDVTSSPISATELVIASPCIAKVIAASDDAVPEIILIATGSEVSLATEVAELLNDKRVRVISMPSWELFEQQSKKYKENLIPQRGCIKVSLEAGITLGWERYVGPSGLMIGLDTYGLSAPYKELADRFGFIPQKVVRKINKHLKKLL
jgi:transketolase